MNNAQVRTRNSNIELLRIACMLMIVVLHFIIHSIYPGVAVGKAPWPVTWLFALCYVAVNCFVLISGYFSIRLSWKKVAAYVFLIMFYALVTGVVSRMLSGGNIGKTLVLGILFPFAHNNTWWFIHEYTLLMLFSPLLNAALKALDNRQLMIKMALALVADVYVGWWGNSDGGYSLIHFIVMYLMGHTLRRWIDGEWRSLPAQGVLLATYLLCAMLWTAMLKWDILPDVIPLKWLAYNNPLTMLGAVALFVLFLRLTFRSKVVNYVAQSAIAAYLLQDGIRYVYTFFSNRFMQPTMLGNIAVIVVASVVFFLGALLFDQLRLFGYRLLVRLVELVRRKGRSEGEGEAVADGEEVVGEVGAVGTHHVVEPCEADA